MRIFETLETLACLVNASLSNRRTGQLAYIYYPTGSGTDAGRQCRRCGVSTTAAIEALNEVHSPHILATVREDLSIPIGGSEPTLLFVTVDDVPATSFNVEATCPLCIRGSHRPLPERVKLSVTPANGPSPRVISFASRASRQV